MCVSMSVWAHWNLAEETGNLGAWNTKIKVNLAQVHEQMRQPVKKYKCNMIIISRYDVRNRFFSRGVNRSSMSMIDTAAFFLVLDDFDHEINHLEPSTLGANGKVTKLQHDSLGSIHI